MSSKYRYTPLHSKNDHIRLLILFPGHNVTVPLRGMLRAVPLAHAQGKFEAISYTWGDEKLISAIEINNKSENDNNERGQYSFEDLFNVPLLDHDGVDSSYLPITPNLDAALRYIRYSSTWRILWADAICIQQADLQEKSQQVKLMGEIYSSCTRTLAWLGTVHPQYSAKCFTYCKAISALKEKYMVSDENVVDDGFHQRRAGLLRNGLSQLLLWVLFRRPWFRRLWCVQELVLPDRVIIQWGEHTLDWDILFDVLEILGLIVRSGHLNAEIMSSWVSEGSFQSLENSKQNPVAKCSWTQPLQLGMARNRFRGLAPRASISFIEEVTGCNMEVDKKQALDDRESLLRLTTQFSQFGCKDPRDRIFALLGICRSTPIIPDYTRHFEEIVKDASISLLRAGDLHQLHYLVAPAALATCSPATSLPSYATFFSHYKQTTIPIGEETKYNAATCVKPCVVLNPPSHNLSCGLISIAGFVIAPLTRIIPNGSSPPSFFLGDVALDQRETLPARAAWLTSVYIALTLEIMPTIAYRTGVSVATAIGSTLGLSFPFSETPPDLLNNIVEYIVTEVSSGSDFLWFLQNPNDQGRLSWLDILSLAMTHQSSGNSTVKAPEDLESLQRSFARQMLGSMSIQTYGRDAALFEGGWIGLVPQGCRQGDWAVIIEGATTPFIMRSEKGNWRILGDTYIEGLMEGEAMQIEGRKREMFPIV